MNFSPAVSPLWETITNVIVSSGIWPLYVPEKIVDFLTKLSLENSFMNRTKGKFVNSHTTIVLMTVNSNLYNNFPYLTEFCSRLLFG
jgi:hypothetical protein